MKYLRPAAPRLSCLNSWSILRTCHQVNSLASILQQKIRPYSICLLPSRRRGLPVSRWRSEKMNMSPFAVIVRMHSSCILTEFDQLPKNYEDEQGLSFRSSPLTDAEVRQIFGNFIDTPSANRMLRIIHGRRVAGTLLDPTFNNIYGKQVWEKGIQWLRKNVPVNEVQNAGQRAELELAEMEEGTVLDAERIGLYKPNSIKGDNVYGEGVFEKKRKENEKKYKRDQEAKERNQADDTIQNTGVPEKLSSKSQVELKQPGEYPWLKYYLEKAKGLDMPPEMTPFQRLWPSGLLVLGVVGSSLLFAQLYTPPKNSARAWPDVPPSAATIITIIAANAIIMLAWRIPPMFRILNQYFVSVPGYPRPASLIGNLFSHQSLRHFAMNMTVLWFVGTRLHDEIGRGNFLAIYMAAGVFGSYASLTSWVLRHNFTSASLGASGSICGIVATYLLLHSPEKITLFGVFPPEDWPSISAITFLAFLVSLDIIQLLRSKSPVTIDHMSHLGGYATGAMSAWLLTKRAQERRKRDAERRKNMGIVDRIKEGRFYTKAEVIVNRVALRRECDEYYVNNYIRWYGTEPFASANGKIAQLNIWDDHDIIDGFGSYVDSFMRCDVFKGIGGVANKYYLLFQHHLPPPLSTYTTGSSPVLYKEAKSNCLLDSPQTTGDNHAGVDPRQLENTFVLEEKKIDPSYIIGSKPGPYVAEHSRSIYARLGRNISFLGIDARTERTRKQVNYPETYEIIFSRLRRELNAAKESSSPISHLIVLLGIPIAYPRLTWLENIFSSPAIAPIKFLNKRFGFGGGFFNHFDGSVDLLDDLDDHWTARNHKRERLFIVQQFQELAAEFSVRITILGGDVHLAAVGRFYSNPKLNIQVRNDHRYMVNVISSAIVNKPPPQAVANLLALRNKLHHLDQNTDETLLKFFDKDPGIAHKTASSNHVTMPSRNWAMITENSARPNHLHHSGSINNHAADTRPTQITSAWKKAKDGHSWLDAGEIDAGTTHKAANMEKHGKGTDGSLDLCIRVEMDQHDKEGRTQLYGMTIPLLDYQGAAENTLRKRDAVHGAINERI